MGFFTQERKIYSTPPPFSPKKTLPLPTITKKENKNIYDKKEKSKRNAFQTAVEES